MTHATQRQQWLGLIDDATQAGARQQQACRGLVSVPYSVGKLIFRG